MRQQTSIVLPVLRQFFLSLWTYNGRVIQTVGRSDNAAGLHWTAMPIRSFRPRPDVWRLRSAQPLLTRLKSTTGTREIGKWEEKKKMWVEFVYCIAHLAQFNFCMEYQDFLRALSRLRTRHQEPSHTHTCVR